MEKTNSISQEWYCTKTFLSYEFLVDSDRESIADFLGNRADGIVKKVVDKESILLRPEVYDGVSISFCVRPRPRKLA